MRPGWPIRESISADIRARRVDRVRIKNTIPEYRIIARLKAGAGIAAAEAELRVIQAEVAKQYTDAHAARTSRL